MIWIKKTTLLAEPLWLTEPGDLYVLAVVDNFLEPGDKVVMRYYDPKVWAGVQEVELEVLCGVASHDEDGLPCFIFRHQDGGIRDTKVREGATMAVLEEEL